MFLIKQVNTNYRNNKQRQNDYFLNEKEQSYDKNAMKLTDNHHGISFNSKLEYYVWKDKRSKIAQKWVIQNLSSILVKN